MSSAVENVDARQELEQLEARANYLRAILPQLVKKFFRFRVKPGRFCMVYAPNRETARERLLARMEASYGNAFQVFPVVDEYEPHEAALNCSQGSNLLDCLAPAEAEEFISDWRADQQGREKAKRASTLERDIALYEFRKRKAAAER